jgi:hypothetical protein
MLWNNLDYNHSKNKSGVLEISGIFQLSSFFLIIGLSSTYEYYCWRGHCNVDIRVIYAGKSLNEGAIAMQVSL